MACAAAASSSLGFRPRREFFNARNQKRSRFAFCCRLGFNTSRGACLVSDRREQIPMPIPLPYSFKGEEKEGEDEPVHPEMLDQWISESVTEIVRNVGDAPLLLQLYSKPNQDSKTRLGKQKAAAETWPLLQRRWKEGSRIPQGVILVERLKGMDDDDDDGSAYWGLLVQGRGLHCGACYILKTNRVQSLSGFCTYFCLVRAKCFGDSSDLQMRNSWLLRTASDSSIHS